MVTLLTILHVLVALVLILVVLLQSARGSDIASAFGGMGSQTAFGPRGTSNFLTRTTAVLAAVFMVTSLTLAVFANRSGRGSGSVLSGEKASPAPAAPAPASGPPQVHTETIPPRSSAPATPVAPGAPAAPAQPAQPAAK